MLGKSLFYTPSLYVLPIVVAMLIACGSENPAPQRASNDTLQVKTGSGEGVDADSSGSSGTITDWLTERYGPASGLIEYEVVSGGNKSTQKVYFKEHGLREARYWQLEGGANPLVHITIVDSAVILVQGPGDPKPLRSGWHPDPKIVLPNFRHLTPEMRQIFAIEELPAKTVLGKECGGYRLKVGEVVSDVWIWEGLLLYGEMQGVPTKKIAPIIMRALSLKLDGDVPEARFHIAEGNG